MMRSAFRAGLAAATMAFSVAAGAAPPSAGARDIVLVHGMGMDGSSWRAVYDILTARGYHVSIAQEPLDGFANDVAAVRRTIAAQHGPVVLVGHSYGGVVITTAGNDPKVGALVYLAAIQPDKGETMQGLNARMPAAFDPKGTVIGADGYVTVKPDTFVRDAAQDLPRATAEFLVAAQTPTSTDVFTAPTTDPAWRHKPVFAVVATEDRTINPALERWMYARSAARTTEIKSGHMVYMSHPREVADVIIRAAQSVTD